MLQDFEYECTCPDGYTGIVCESVFNFCESDPCEEKIGFGICQYSHEGYTCSCFRGRVYDDQAGAIDDNCSGYLDTCASSPCVNGHCQPDHTISIYICECDPGFEGINCDQVISPCKSFPCGEGVCLYDQDNPTVFTCECPIYKTGTLCEDLVDYCRSNPCNRGQCIG